MTALLNRFAWGISVSIALFASYFVDRNALFDDDGLIAFIVVLLLLKFLVFSKKWIHRRLEYFVDTIKEELEGQKKQVKKEKISQNVVTSEMEEESREILGEGDILPGETVKETKDEKSSVSMSEEVGKLEKKTKVSWSPFHYIGEFFKENLLAKVGGILIFLAVIFGLNLVYSYVGPVGKMLIGFFLGFGMYLSGVILVKKKLQGEGMILLGLGIVINYGVILAGRYLIGDDSGNLMLSELLCFTFLVLNTVFAIVTSLVYHSKSLLVFALIFAYVNPLLIGGSSDTPYTLVAYTLLVSFASFYLAKRQSFSLLLYLTYIFASILFLITPMQTDIHWVMKVGAFALVSIISLFQAYTFNKKSIPWIFGGSYLFFIIFLMLAGDANMLLSGKTFISYIVYLLVFFALGIYFFLQTLARALFYSLLAPLFIVLGLMMAGDVPSFSTLLAFIVFLYIYGFDYLESILCPIVKYSFYALFGGFIIGANILSIFHFSELSLVNFLTSILVAFVFILSSYTLSRKPGLEYLYSIGTFLGVLMLAPVIVETENGLVGPMVYVSIATVIIFALLHWWIPFHNKDLTDKPENLKNLVIGSVIGVLFLGYELFTFGELYFPGVMLGGAFVILAIFYFFLGVRIMQKFGENPILADAKTDERPYKNTVLGYLGISLSIFSLSIALIFSDLEQVVSMIWMLEATLLYFFYRQTEEKKILYVGNILSIIGIGNLISLVPYTPSGDLWFGIPLVVAFVSLFLNVRFLSTLKSGVVRYLHDFFHLVGIVAISIMLSIIIPHTSMGWNIFGVGVFMFLISWVYARFPSPLLSWGFVLAFFGFAISHMFSIDYIFRSLDFKGLAYLRVLQYLVTFFLAWCVLFFYRYEASRGVRKSLLWIYIIYVVMIVSLYVYDIFATTFAITIFWGLLGSWFLFYGIFKNYIFYRTLGLYVVSGVLVKIFFYDIWYGFDDAISRVIAFLVLGILLVVISILYSKKYSSNIKGEFHVKNFNELKLKKHFAINEAIRDISVDQESKVRFAFAGGEVVSIQTRNIIKIAKLVTNKFGKDVFAPGELASTYEYIVKNYKSQLLKKDYDQVVEILKRFVTEGGRIQMVMSEIEKK